MSSIKTTSLNKKDAKRDIDYCLKNARTKKCMDEDYFTRNPHIYLNTSENVKEAVQSSVGEGSKVLTVASSGDYCLESIFRGADEVVNFDINQHQYYMTCLKYWAVLNLSYDEYCSCFRNFRRDDLLFMSDGLLRKAVSGFEREIAYPFWDRLIQERKREQDKVMEFLQSPSYKILTGYLGMHYPVGLIDYAINALDEYPEFRGGNALRIFESPEAKEDTYGYLMTEENFNTLKERLRKAKVSFQTSDIRRIKNRLYGEEDFNAIFLSNIPFYIPSKDFVSAVDDQIAPLLAPGGEISYYCQNMSADWMIARQQDPNYHVPITNFGRDYMMALNQEGVERCIASYAKLTENYDVELEEIPAYGGTPGILAPTDVKVLVRRK